MKSSPNLIISWFFIVSYCLHHFFRSDFRERNKITCIHRGVSLKKWCDAYKEVQLFSVQQEQSEKDHQTAARDLDHQKGMS
mmetsp:Transcript_21320/g.30479  ORF Transcript_21320/g.30479 Transcript_21320/m.30479 type:complete len:81 (+) Transcript_21320:90-332(+)